MINLSVVAVGLVGVWRATQLDYVSSDDTVIEEMGNEERPFQPEEQNFRVMEILSGNSLH